jgi:hypothetical protein
MKLCNPLHAAKLSKPQRLYSSNTHPFLIGISCKKRTTTERRSAHLLHVLLGGKHQFVIDNVIGVVTQPRQGGVGVKGTLHCRSEILVPARRVSR